MALRELGNRSAQLRQKSAGLRAQSTELTSHLTALGQDIARALSRRAQCWAGQQPTTTPADDRASGPGPGPAGR